MSRKNRHIKGFSWRRKLLWFILLLLVATVLLFSYFLLNLNHLVKSEIEKKGSSIIQTAVGVSKIHLNLLGGRCVIENLTIANPHDFRQPYFLKVRKLEIRFSVFTLFKTVIKLKYLIIDRPQLTMEINKNRKNNLLKIRKNVKKHRDPEKNPTRLTIDRLVLNSPELTMHLDGRKARQYVFQIPSSLHKNLSGTVRQIVKQLMLTLIKQVLETYKKRKTSAVKSTIKNTAQKAGKIVKNHLQKRSRRNNSK